jgi:hypothetical protein
MSGGVILIINKGIYTVGSETFARGIGKGYAYLGRTMLKIDSCTKPVIIKAMELL